MDEVKSPATPSTRVVKSPAASPFRKGQVVYDVWLMTGLLDKRRIASKATLHEAYEAITPEHRANFVYILKWTPVTEAATHEASAFGPEGRFGAHQGQHGLPKPSPTCQYIWGCLCDRVHTNDMRDQVRAILRSN